MGYATQQQQHPNQLQQHSQQQKQVNKIDLAHHPMYSTCPMFGTNTITGVTMSHPSQWAFASHKNGMNPGKVLTSNSKYQQSAGSEGGGSSVIVVGGMFLGSGGGPGSGIQSPVNSGSMLCLTSVGGGVAAMHQQQQQQLQPPSSVICTSLAPSSLVGISNGLHLGGVPSAAVVGCF